MGKTVRSWQKKRGREAYDRKRRVKRLRKGKDRFRFNPNEEYDK